MTVFNLGSINADHVYSVPHLPAPGETLLAIAHSVGLGGKGANQSVAAAMAGAQVHHIGAIGPEGGWARDRLAEVGVGVTHVSQIETPTAHAIIAVDPAGENAIIVFPGANVKQSLTQVKSALSEAGEGDTLLLQNETNLQVEAAKFAREQGMTVIYSAAPFDADAAAEVLPHVSLLVMNEVEAEQLQQALGTPLSELPVQAILVTAGSSGARWYVPGTDEVVSVSAFRVDPVDTTGAGDCFIGYVAAGLDAGLNPEQAMRLGTAASAIQVTRPGTADAIPARAEVDAFLKEHQ